MCECVCLCYVCLCMYVNMTVTVCACMRVSTWMHVNMIVCTNAYMDEYVCQFAVYTAH
jgi:hypothetical protein